MQCYYSGTVFYGERGHPPCDGARTEQSATENWQWKWSPPYKHKYTALIHTHI